MISKPPSHPSHLFLIQYDSATWVGCPISGFLEPNVGEMNRQCPNPRPAEDPRAMISLARVNWLHSHYRIVSGSFLLLLREYSFSAV